MNKISEEELTKMLLALPAGGPPVSLKFGVNFLAPTDNLTEDLLEEIRDLKLLEEVKTFTKNAQELRQNLLT